MAMLTFMVPGGMPDIQGYLRIILAVGKY